MNGLARIAAVLVLLTGLGFVWLLALVVRDDLLFFACAQPHPVTIEKIDVERQRIGDPVHASSSVSADIALTMRRGGLAVQAGSSIVGSETDVQERLDALHRRVGREAPMLLCDRFPTRFALEPAFPWKGVAAALLVIAVTILPSAGALAHDFRSRRRRARLPANDAGPEHK